MFAKLVAPLFEARLVGGEAAQQRDLVDIGTGDVVPFVTDRGLTGKKALQLPGGQFLRSSAAAEYDATMGLTDDERHHQLYVFLEPMQTKQVYWRAKAGAEKIRGEDLEPKWDLRLKLNAEWRSEPWIPKNRRGLKAVKLPD